MPELDDYLETQYNNRAAVPSHPAYLQSWLQRSEDYRQRMTSARLDVSYGASQHQLLDIFPAQQADAPVHVFIHGGYWQALSKDSFSFFAETLNQQGECAVIVNYSLCPQVTIEQIIQQIRAAVEWVYHYIENYGGNPNNMQVSGHSAGGHLLACLLTTDWSEFGLTEQPFKQLNALSGLFDLQPLLETSINKALGLDETKAVSSSPLFQSLWKPDSTIRLSLLVGDQESDEYKRQSAELLRHWSDYLYIHIDLAKETHHFSILDTFLSAHYRAL